MLLLLPAWAHETGLSLEAGVPWYRRQRLLISLVCKVRYSLTRVSFKSGCIIFISVASYVIDLGLEVEAFGKAVVWMFFPGI